MEERLVLCESDVIRPMPRWMSVSAVLLGIALLYDAYIAYFASGLNARFAYGAALGFISIYAAGLNRRMYLSDVGVVRESLSWGRKLCRVLPWEDVQYASLAFRGGRMMLFLEVGVRGWKIPFTREREADVRRVLADMIPGVDVDTAEKH
ncbi:MAG: hypothetical protein LBT31_10460 [Synergistaceae bacterium]|nr:hypothetical protein [Synergistaceae bacterium]